MMVFGASAETLNTSICNPTSEQDRIGWFNNYNGVMEVQKVTTRLTKAK